MKLVALFAAAVLMAGLGSVKAQTVSATPNLITNTWTGVTPSTSTGGGFSGGNVPAYNSTTNTVMFGYNQATVAQTYAINQALSGSGVQIGGYNYSWQYLNNGSTGGTLSSTIRLTNPTGSTLESYTYGMNVIADGWRTMSGTQNFNQQYGLSSVGNLEIAFTGKDARWWAGLYGPQVRDVNLSLNYTVDPCVANPLYSPSCSGYNQVINSQTIYAQSYAINQALNLSGAGVNINGLEYGYNYYVGGEWCSSAFLIFCTGWSQSSMAVDVNVTSNVGTSLYSATHNHGPNTSGTPSYSYVFPTQRLLSTMGNFSLSTREVGTTALYSSWSRWQYTPDPCVVDPLSSASCPGYAAAYQVQQCSANPLYNSACPGYAAAMFAQQCSANPLLDPACPGYASAYLTYQCSINPLYSTTCAGYETAYFDQQCSINPLYNSRCPGYATAYKNQQCTLDGLYARDCPNYADAYARRYVIGIPSSGTISYGPADSRCTVGCDTSTTQNSNAGPATSGYSGPGATNVSTTQPMTSISNSGQVSTGVALTNDSNVNAVIATPKMDGPAASTGNSPVASSMNSPGPAASGSSTQTANAGPATRQEQKSEDKKDDAPKGSGGGSSSQNTGTAQASSDKPAAPTARQELQARREAAAKAEAVEKGKNLANEMGKAADMETQKAVQNVVIQAMGFTPGFDAYGKQMIVQQQFYPPYAVYTNQRNIDNRANLRMFGGADRLHNEMVEKQYEGR